MSTTNGGRGKSTTTRIDVKALIIVFFVVLIGCAAVKRCPVLEVQACPPKSLIVPLVVDTPFGPLPIEIKMEKGCVDNFIEATEKRGPKPAGPNEVGR